MQFHKGFVMSGRVAEPSQKVAVIRRGGVMWQKWELMSNRLRSSSHRFVLSNVGKQRSRVV